MADNKEPIYQDTLPAVSLGDGPFIRQDTGDSGIGYCSIPSRGAGEFGIPSGVPEEMIRAVEMHEYMHLALINMVPEIQDMHLQMRKDGVPDKVIQGVGDLIVNRISKDPHVRSNLEGLRLAESDEKLLEYMVRSNTMERIVLGIRAQSTEYLAAQFDRIINGFLDHLIGHPEPHEEGLPHTELIAKKREEVDLIVNTVKTVSKNICEQASLFSREMSYPGMDTDDIHENVSLMAIPPEKRDIYENICCGPIHRGAMPDAIALSEMVKTVYQIAENTKAVEEMKERERREEDSSDAEDEDEGESSTKPADAAEDPDEVLEKARKYDASHIRTHARSTRDKVPWGEMTIVSIPFTEALRNDMTRRKVRYGLEGPFRYPHRMPPAGDGSCFSRKRKIRGGTVLIDWSGSMGMTNKDVRDIIMMLPAATIAAYSGCGTGGNLMILAKDGMVGDLRSCDGYRGGGNIIDGPALEWLASQQKPQIWVSDGHVTGVGDCPSADLMSQAMAFITNRKIIRIPNLSTVKQFVQKHRNMFLH